MQFCKIVCHTAFCFILVFILNLYFTLYYTAFRWLYACCYTEWFMTCGHYCRRWFPRYLWSKKLIKNLSNFGRLRSYGRFLIPVHALVWTASHGTSWRVMYSAWWLIFCVASVISASWHSQFTTERQPLLRPAVAFSKTSFKHRLIQIKGNFTTLTLHLYFKCIMYYAGLLFCSVYCNNRYLLF